MLGHAPQHSPQTLSLFCKRSHCIPTAKRTKHESEAGSPAYSGAASPSATSSVFTGTRKLMKPVIKYETIEASSAHCEAVASPLHMHHHPRTCRSVRTRQRLQPHPTKNPMATSPLTMRMHPQATTLPLLAATVPRAASLGRREAPVWLQFCSAFATSTHVTTITCACSHKCCRATAGRTAAASGRRKFRMPTCTAPASSPTMRRLSSASTW